MKKLSDKGLGVLLLVICIIAVVFILVSDLENKDISFLIMLLPVSGMLIFGKDKENHKNNK